MASSRPCETWLELLDSTRKCQTLFEEIERAIIEPDDFKYSLALASLHLPGNTDGSSVPMVFKRRLDLIKSRVVRIMVAGDTSAGKSTLMNIIMGGNYLPVQSTPTTKVFCELQVCLERSVTFQFEPVTFVCTQDETLVMPEDPTHQKWLDVRESIKTRKRKGRQLRKVLIRWPIDIDAIEEGTFNDPDQTAPKDIVGFQDPIDNGLAVSFQDSLDDGASRVTYDPDVNDQVSWGREERVDGSIKSRSDIASKAGDEGTFDDRDQTTPMQVVGSQDPDQTTSMQAVGSHDRDQTTRMQVVGSHDPDQTTPMQVVGSHDPDQTTPMQVVGSQDPGQTTPMQIVGFQDPERTSPKRVISAIDTGLAVSFPDDRDDFNVIFVDTPGITTRTGREREVFDEIGMAGSMYQAFILVIKETDVREEGLQALMDDIENSIKDRTDMINQECTIFIANQFDRIPMDERDAVKQHIRGKLLEKWPRIDDKNVIFMSAKRNVIYGDLRSSSTETFMSRLREFVKKAIRITLEEHCLWLLNLLEITRAITKSGEQWIAIRHTKQQLEQTLLDFRTEAINLAEELNFRPDSEVDALYEETSKELRHHLVETPDWDVAEIIKNIPNDAIDWEDLMRVVDGMICDKILKSKMAPIAALRRKHQLKWENIYSSQVTRLKKLQNRLAGMSTSDASQSVNKEGMATALVPVALCGVIRAAPAVAPFLFLAVPLLPIPLLLKSFVDEYKDYKNEQLRESFKHDMVEFVRKRTKDLSRVFEQPLQSHDVKHLKASPLFCEFIGKFPKDILLEQIEQVLSTIQLLRGLGSSNKLILPHVFDKYLPRVMEIYTNDILRHEIHSTSLHWSRDRERNRKRLGNNGQVYKAKLDLLGTVGPVDVAVKELEYKRSSDSRPDTSIHSDLDIYRECFLLRQLSRSSCENVVKYYGSSFMSESGETETTCRLRLVFELCDRGTLDVIIRHPVRNEAVRRNEFWWYAYETTKGLKFLHDKNIVHRDMKPANCLLMSGNTPFPCVKIADVGAAKQRDLICTDAQKRGSFAYWAPEIVERTAIKFHSKASDVYSLGLVLWELWFRKYAYQDFNILAGKVPNRFPKQDPEVTAILKMCLQRRPEQRAKIEVLQQRLRNIRDRITPVSEGNEDTRL